MSQPQLWKVTYEDKKGGYKLDCYADVVVSENPDSPRPKLAAIRFGGEPEKVRGLADAIYGGGSIEVEPDLKLDTCLKQYQRQISHDGIYAEATLVLRDSEPEPVSQKDSPKQTTIEGPPQKHYIFCPQGDMEYLFREIDWRTGVPLIPEFQDYLLAELQQKHHPNGRGRTEKRSYLHSRLDAGKRCCLSEHSKRHRIPSEVRGRHRPADQGAVRAAL